MRQFTMTALVLCLLAVPFYFYPEYARKHTSLLILNSSSRGKLPEKFHTTPQASSGSSQFSQDGLKQMLQVIPNKKVVIVDLREEPHGFINGDAISWYRSPNWVNEGKHLKEILEDEKNRLQSISKQFFTLTYKKKSNFPSPYQVKNVLTEEDIVREVSDALGTETGYLRLPVRDHTRPSDQIVDTFVDYVQNLRGGEWLHFHCSKGHGRTTTFLAMYDMMQHATTTPLETIILRQAAYGGINLFANLDDNEWKTPYKLEKKAFLEQFYQYCRQNPEFTVSWAQWIQRS